MLLHVLLPGQGLGTIGGIGIIVLHILLHVLLCIHMHVSLHVHVLLQVYDRDALLLETAPTLAILL